MVSNIKTAGSPRTPPSNIKGINCTISCGGVIIELTIRILNKKQTYNVNMIAAGRVTVPISSRMITNCIEKQNVPQSSLTSVSSMRLCTVELIHRRRCDSKMLNVLGTVVLQYARGTNISLRFGNARSIIVVKNLSSPNNSRFFLCSVSTLLDEYMLTMSGHAKIGTQPPFFGALILYMEKQPGRHVTPPKHDSKALVKWWDR